MLSPKIWASAVLWLLFALPVAVSQTSETASIPNWEFGLRGGIGFNMYHIKKEGFATYVFSEAQVSQEQYLGGFATRNFNRKWSLRTELSGVFGSESNNAVTIGVYPRYHLTKWLGIEAGIEARNVLKRGENSSSKLWLGTVLSWKNTEFNLRFSPGYTPKTPYLESTWQSSVQVGASFKLAKVGKLFSGKK